MFIPEFILGMIAGFVLGVSTLIITAVVYDRLTSDEQDLEEK